MVLKILKSKEENLTDMYLTPEEFADPAYHPFIATTEFDKVIVELCDEIPTGYISQIVAKGNKVIPIIGKLDDKVVALLCEMYPEHRAEIRFTYMRKRAEFQNVLDKLACEYNWTSELRC